MNEKKSSDLVIPNVLIINIGHLQIGITKGLKVFGLCWKDKNCWTNKFGYEILMD